MEVIHHHCAGLDVQKKTVFVYCLTLGVKGEKISQTGSFSNSVQGLLALSDWLGSNSITHVALDIGGEDWKIVYHILEANFNVLVVNAQRMKEVPGRNTQIEAEWIAQLLRHGLIHDSFIHPVPHRDLRDLIRHRHYLVQQRASLVNQLYKVLESANVKLASLVSDVMHISTRALLLAIAQGETNVSDIGNLAHSFHQQQQSEPAYFKHVRSHHRFLIANHLNHIDFLDRQIAGFNAKIAEYIQQKITQTVAQNSSKIQPDISTSTAPVQTAKLIPNWEEALAAFLKGGRI